MDVGDDNKGDFDECRCQWVDGEREEVCVYQQAGGAVGERRRECVGVTSHASKSHT